MKFTNYAEYKKHILTNFDKTHLLSREDFSKLQVNMIASFQQIEFIKKCEIKDKGCDNCSG